MSAAYPRPPHLVFVGLTGGIGAGKSTVASLLQELGALWINADRMAQEELDRVDVQQRVVAAFGPAVAGGGGLIDRAQLASIVFGDPDKLRALEAILHPRVQARAYQAILEWPGTEQQPGIALLDIPLLEKSPFVAWCDYRVFVDAGRAARLERLERNRGWSAAELDRREANQQAVDEKRRAADVIIDNGGSIVATKIKVHEIWDRMRKERIKK